MTKREIIGKFMEQVITTGVPKQISSSFEYEGHDWVQITYGNQKCAYVVVDDDYEDWLKVRPSPCALLQKTQIFCIKDEKDETLAAAAAALRKSCEEFYLDRLEKDLL